jgi:hypothetical protein
MNKPSIDIDTLTPNAAPCTPFTTPGRVEQYTEQRQREAAEFMQRDGLWPAIVPQQGGGK